MDRYVVSKYNNTLLLEYVRPHVVFLKAVFKKNFRGRGTTFFCKSIKRFLFAYFDHIVLYWISSSEPGDTPDLNATYIYLRYKDPIYFRFSV